MEKLLLTKYTALKLDVSQVKFIFNIVHNSVAQCTVVTTYETSETDFRRISKLFVLWRWHTAIVAS